MFDENKPLEEKLGTPYYIAPEVLAKKYGPKCDVWSCGVITYILLSGTPPFNGSSDQEIMKKVRSGQFAFSDSIWDKISANAKDFITKLLIKDQAQRPSAEEALQHSWIVDMSKQTVDHGVALSALQNLKSFRADQKLKQATFAYMASQLITKSEKEYLSKVFRALDANNDGRLSKDEILNGWEKEVGKPISKEEVDAIYDQVDIDKSGEIDYSEFIIATINTQNLLTKEKLQAAFKMFDKDNSGSISKEEIKQVLGFGQSVASDEIAKVISQVDDDGNGQISFAEFEKMMQNIYKWGAIN